MKGSNLAVAGIAFVVVGLASLVPVLGLVFLGPLAALVVGAIAAWRAASSTVGSRAGAGLRAGSIAGIGALLGATVAVAVFAVILGGDPTVQELVRQSEPHPEARVPYELIQPIAAATGAFVGLLAGFGNLVLSAFAGLIAGLIAGRKGESYVESVAR